MNNSISLDSEVLVVINDQLAFSSAYEFNGLFKVDLIHEKCEYMGLFPNEEIYKEKLHCTAKYVNKKIYFIPASANNISVYDIEKDKIYSIKIPYVQLKSKFRDACVFNNKLWLVPSKYPGIITLDLDSEHIEVMDKWLPSDDYFFTSQLVVIDHKFYISDGISNRVFEFDMNNKQAKFHYVGSNNHGCMSMSIFHDEFIMIPRLPGSIVRWNIHTNEIKEYCDYPDDFSPGKIVFSGIYIVHDAIYCIPAYANMAVKFDLNNNMITANDFCDIFDGNDRIAFFTRFKNYIYCKTIKNGVSRHIKFFIDDNKAEEYCIPLNDDIKNILKKAFFQNIKESSKHINIYENVLFNLEDFFDIVLFEQNNNRKEKNQDNNGEKIWTEISGDII